MDEEVKWMMSRQLRCLFAQILIHFQSLHPKKLWESFKVAMLEDYTRHRYITRSEKSLHSHKSMLYFVLLKVKV